MNQLGITNQSGERPEWRVERDSTEFLERYVRNVGPMLAEQKRGYNANGRRIVQMPWMWPHWERGLQMATEELEKRKGAAQP